MLIMKALSRLAFLACPLPVVSFAISCFGAQSLPDDWWLQDSPEKVLAKAQSINQDLAFFQAEKSGSILSQITNPFANTNDNEHTDFLQRRNADGFVETKNVHSVKNFQLTEYKLKTGNYFFVYEQIIKMEFIDGEDLEKTIATKVNHPYDFKILKSEMVGTNDCIIIARTMTEPLLKAAADVYYEKYSPEKRIELGTNYIRAETDFYFRKSDGVTLGLIKRNRAGELLEDEVYDAVEINQPIPDREFSLPKGEMKIAKNAEEMQKIEHDAMTAMRAKTPKNPAATPTPSPVEIAVEKRVSELPWATNLPNALTQAKAENKIVLLDFTGSDWCVWCMKFDNDVLSQPEFAAYAKTNLVMFMLDFPNAIKQSEALKKSNQELQAKFKVDGFPTYIALNSDGKEMGRQVGYLSGGPQAFIAELEKFRKQ